MEWGSGRPSAGKYYCSLQIEYNNIERLQIMALVSSVHEWWKWQRFCPVLVCHSGRYLFYACQLALLIFIHADTGECNYLTLDKHGEEKYVLAAGRGKADFAKSSFNQSNSCSTSIYIRPKMGEHTQCLQWTQVLGTSRFGLGMYLMLGKSNLLIAVSKQTKLADSPIYKP